MPIEDSGKPNELENPVEAYDRSMAEITFSIVEKIISAYEGGKINLDRCVTLLYQERDRFINDAMGFPRYSEWIEVQWSRYIDEHLDKHPEALEELKITLQGGRT